MKKRLLRLWLWIRFFIRVKMFGVPFLYEKERLFIYKMTLKLLEERIKQNDKGWQDLNYYCLYYYHVEYSDKYGYDFIDPLNLKINFPELYKLRPGYCKTNAEGHEEVLWFDIDVQGTHQRSAIVLKAILSIQPDYLKYKF